VFAPKLTVAGAVATPGLLELRLIVRPPVGAGADRMSVRFCVVVPLIVRLPGEKLIVVLVPPVVTCTSPVAGAKPLADAVTIADPALMPFTIGARLGAVTPCGMKIFSGATVTFEVSLLVSVMNTPPDGAGFAKVTEKFTCWPGATVVLAGRMIPDAAGEETIALAVAFPKPGVIAVIVAEPAATPVTGTFTLVAPAANVTVAGTVATPVLLELRLAVRLAGAGPDRFSVRFCVEPALIARLAGEKELLPPLVITCTCPLPGV
jgi:hypothetical protein